jgi:RNA polymerase-binding protein DksA
MENILLSEKNNILQKLKESNDDFRKIVENIEAKDVIDVAADDIDKKLIETLGNKDVNRLKQIDSALSRIKAGRYGNCLSCGNRIDESRLEALPYTLLCLECKSRDEKRRRT